VNTDSLEAVLEKTLHMKVRLLRLAVAMAHHEARFRRYILDELLLNVILDVKSRFLVHLDVGIAHIRCFILSQQ
jgi:hypothetical protein